MSLRSRMEGAGALLALLLVIAFIVSAVAGMRLRAPSAPAADRAAATGSVVADSLLGAGIRVEVLNGSGRPGLARDATERLRAAGFDVVYFGNAGEPRGISLVLDRGGRAEAARRAAAALGIATVRSEPDESRFVDVTVIVAKDWPPRVAPVKEGWFERFKPWVKSGSRDTLTR